MIRSVVLRRLSSLMVVSLLGGCGDDGAVTSDAGTSTGDEDSSSTSGVTSSGPNATSSTSADSAASSTTAEDTGSTSLDETTTGMNGSTSTTGSSESSSSTGGEPNFADPRGYTLLAPLGSRFTYLMDEDGLEINRWESTQLPANSAYMLPNGHMIRVARDPNPIAEVVSGAGGIVEEFDWDGNMVWQYEHTGPTILAHHDIEVLPNGNVLIVAYEMFSVDDAIAAGRDPNELSPDGLWADFVVEVDPTTDAIVWEWHVWDHLVQDFDPMAADFDVIADRPERIDINWRRPGESPRPDWTHINAITYSAELDQIIVSPRTFSELWIIDHSTTTAEAASSSGGNAGRGGDIIYRWGNPGAYDAGDPILDRQLWYQHNPRWIPDGHPGAGNILVFDNGDPTYRPYSRIVEIETPLQPDGTYDFDGMTYGPDAPVLVFEDPKAFFAPFISGSVRLSDGRTIVCDGPLGHLFEVSPEGTLGDWSFEVNSPVFRAERYEADDPAWDGLTEEDLAPGDPLIVELE